MSKVINKLLILGLTLSIVLPCSAAGVIGVSYNGEEIYLEQEPQNIKGNVLLPLRSLSQSLGYEVNWNSGTKQIDIIQGATNIKLIIDSDTAEVNGEEIKINTPAQVIKGTTYVPLRFVGEALNMDVSWDGKTQTVNLEGKYTLDEKNKELLVRTEEGKKVIAKINTLNEFYDHQYVNYYMTKGGGEIVSVNQIIQGAAGSGSTSTCFYIRDGIIIDKIENDFNYECSSGVIEYKDKIVFNDESKLKFYDDKTGELIKTYDLNDFQKGLSLDIMKVDEDYIMGRHEMTIHVVDLRTGKVTRILDLIPEEDQESVFQSDLYLTTDNIDLVWETDTELVFKYYSITEKMDKTVICKLGD